MLGFKTKAEAEAWIDTTRCEHRQWRLADAATSHALEAAHLIADHADSPSKVGAAVMPVETRQLYSSSNGDRWYLARDTEAGHVFIKHEPNVSSGGQPSNVEIGEFLVRGGSGPEHQELLRLIATLVEDPSQPKG